MCDKNVKFSKKRLKIFSEIIRGMNLIFCIHDIENSLYINSVILLQFDQNCGCYGSVKFPIGILKLPFIALLMQIFLKKFYRNVSVVVFFQPCRSCQNV